MKTIQLMAFLVLALSINTAAVAGTEKVDPSKSSVKWVAQKVTGEHSGAIGIKEGSLEVKNGQITGGKVVIDMATMVVEDIKDAAMNAKLTGHLKSDDFFGVATFPTSELAITKVVSSGNSYTFSGNLTIKGITNPASFTTTSVKDGKNTIYTGTLVVDRSKYNVKYRSKSFFEDLGDKMIYDEFTLNFNLVVAE